MPFHEQIHRYNIITTWLSEDCGDDIASATILDIGCHDGTLCRDLLRRGASVTGIDVYSPELARDTIWRYYQQDLNHTKSLPFPDATFSAITALEILEHIIDTDFFLKELIRVLKPGGYLFLSTPNINMLKNRFRVPLGLYPYGIEWHTVIHHVRLYNLATLRGHLEQTGFRVQRQRGTHLLPQRLLGSRTLLWLSNVLSRWFPQLASNLVIECEKPKLVPLR